MPTLIDFRRRIRSIKNTQQITRAMKFVAAAKLRRAQENVMAARPYARQMISLLRSAMVRRAMEFLHEHAGQELQVIPIGKKGRDALRKRKANLVGKYVHVFLRVEF